MSISFRHTHDSALTTEVSALIAGTGGLGVVGLTKLVADSLGARFACVHTEETRGIAQRRAPVRAVVRAGRTVRSARLPDGLVDMLLAVEAAEGLRGASHVTAGTMCVVADLLVPASGAMSAATSVVTVPRVVSALEARGADVLVVPVAQWLRRERLPEMLSSTAIFGAASHLLGSTLEQAESRLARQIGKRMWAQNFQALQIGYAAASGVRERAAVSVVEQLEQLDDFELVAA